MEQDGQVLFGAADGTQMDLLAGPGGEDDVERANLGHLFEEFARRRAQAAALHPVLERAPHHQRQEAYEDMGLGTSGLLVINRPQAQVVFADAEAVLDLRQADVGLPERGGVLSLEVGA